jgi:hypothetical protein
MITYNITEEEKNMIEALYFEKNAKDNILNLFMSRNEYTIDTKIFNKVYDEAISANIAYSAAFNEIVSKYISKGKKYKDARIEFYTNELTIEEE